MIKLKSLKMAGIGRFVEEQTIDFTSLGNLVQVDGLNNNTGGSSGAGKSTVFNALDYLLGLNDVPNTVLQCRFAAGPMAVSGLFDLDGQEVVITRAKSKLSVKIGETLVSGSNKLAEEKLDEILAMPRHLFRPMLHKRQREGGFFLKLTPKEIHEFLTDCTGLTAYRVKLNKLEEKIKELTPGRNDASARMDQAKSALKATQDAIQSLGPAPVQTVSQDSLREIKAVVDEYSGYFKTAQDKALAELAEVDSKKPTPQLTPFDTSRLDAFLKEQTEIRRQRASAVSVEKERLALVNKQLGIVKVDLNNFGYKIGQGKLAEVEAINTAQQIKKIRDSLCPTCEQTWVTEKAKEAEAQLLIKLKSLRDAIEEGKVSAQKHAIATETLKSLESDLSPHNSVELAALDSAEAHVTTRISNERQEQASHNALEARKNSAVMNNFIQTRDEFKAIHATNINGIRAKLDHFQRTFQERAAAFKSFQEMSTRYNTTLTTLRNKEEDYGYKINELTAYLAKLDVELLAAEEIKRAIKSYVSRSFDEALEAIGNTATALIRNIPNMANATIQLVGTRETQAGKVKEEVNALIHMDGEEAIPIRSLCGGELSAVDLAVDLSVIELIENKTGKGIDIFILDEPFTGLDTVCIEMALEVLKNTNLSKKLIIVDHNPEVKQMVESKLLVVRDGAVSTISQQ